MKVLSVLEQSTFYPDEVSGLKKHGYHLEVPEDQIFHHLKQQLIATKRIGNRKIKIYITTAPCHFFTIEIPTTEKSIFILETGSGSIDKYLDNLQPTIELIQKSMLVVHEKIKKNPWPLLIFLRLCSNNCKKGVTHG